MANSKERVKRAKREKRSREARSAKRHREAATVMAQIDDDANLTSAPEQLAPNEPGQETQSEETETEQLTEGGPTTDVDVVSEPGESEEEQAS